MADQCRSCQLSSQGVQWFEHSPKHGGLFRCLKQLDPHVNGASETPVCHLVFCLKAGHGLSWHLAGFISKSRRFTMFRRQFIDVYNLKAKDPWGNCSCTTRSWDFRQSWPMQKKKTVSRKVARINEPNHARTSVEESIHINTKSRLMIQRDETHVLKYIEPLF